MILTVTLNAAIDVTYEAERFVLGEPNVVESAHRRAGGKGLNVAETLHRLGLDVVATGLAGGRVGEAIREDLAARGIPQALVAVAGESRVTVTAVSRADGSATSYNEQGPDVCPGEWRALKQAFGGLVAAAQLAVLSGSVPPGVPDTAYAELGEIARSHDVPVLLDATGVHLLRGLEGGVHAVKPNRAELESVMGGPCRRRGDVLAAAARLRELGAHAVVASLGRDGLVAVGDEGTWHAMAPAETLNPVGAGDAAVAALAAGVREDRDWPEQARHAAALSAAAAEHPVAGGFDPDRYAELLALTRVEPLE